MITKTEMADVLEKAADLYEAEQYEWCAGDWFEEDVDGNTLTVCASTALAIACGAGVRYAQIMESDYALGTGRWVDYSGTYDIEGEAFKSRVLYLATREHVDKVLDQALPAWNDATAPEDDGLVCFSSLTRNKAAVIEKFKEIAKDLRNEE